MVCTSLPACAGGENGARTEAAPAAATTQSDSPNVTTVEPPRTRHKMPSPAMEPTLHCARPTPGCEADASDTMVVEHGVTDLRRGDLVMFEKPPRARQVCGGSDVYVKRVVGLPGERVELRLLMGLSYLYVNGTKLDEPYIARDRRDAREPAMYAVPSDHYFVVGDNRPKSCDSRTFGPLPRKNLIGKVVAIERPGRDG